ARGRCKSRHDWSGNGRATPTVKPLYSYRSACVGCTAAPRRAGIHAAISATPGSTNPADTNVPTSSGVTPNSIVRATPHANAAGTPQHSPTPTASSDPRIREIILSRPRAYVHTKRRSLTVAPLYREHVR